MKIILIISILALTACASWIPASAKKVDEGVYIVSTTGNMFASDEKMKLKLDKKSESLCKGEGYEYRGSDGVTIAEQKDYTSGVVSSYKVLELTVVCNQ